MASNKVRRIEHMTFEEKQTFFDSFDTVFCDCDGVLWNILSGAIEGSADAIEKLRGLGKKVVFVTNNSLLSSEEYLKKFNNCNIKCNKEDIVHPAETICSYLKKINFKGLIYCIASDSFKNYLIHESGFQLFEEKNHSLKTLIELHMVIDADQNNDQVTAVVIDVDLELTACKLIEAQIHLKKNTKCMFLAGAADTLVNFGQMEVIGPGLFIELLEKATGRKALVFGKPGICLQEILKEKYRYTDTSRVLFIGDNLSSDIKFAKKCGFQAMLVCAKYADLHNLTNSDIPDYVAKSMSELLK